MNSSLSPKKRERQNLHQSDTCDTGRLGLHVDVESCSTATQALAAELALKVCVCC